LANIVGVLGAWSLPVVSVPGKPAKAGLFESCFAGLADGLASSFVFVVRGDVSDAGVEPDPVVARPRDLQFGAQGGGLADGERVRVLALEVPVEALDPGPIPRSLS
jgi:hypothetical protein